MICEHCIDHRLTPARRSVILNLGGQDETTAFKGDASVDGGIERERGDLHCCSVRMTVAASDV